MKKSNFTYKTSTNIIKSIKIQALIIGINANELIDAAVKDYLSREFDLYIVEEGEEQNEK